MGGSDWKCVATRLLWINSDFRVILGVMGHLQLVYSICAVFIQEDS